MKTQKQNAKTAETVKVPKEISQYQQAVKKFVVAFDALKKLKDTPAVQEYLARTGQSKVFNDPPSPKTEEEKKKEELEGLYSDFFRAWNLISDYILILSELAHKSADLSIEQLSGMITEIDKKSWIVRHRAARAFQLHGIVKDEEMSADQIKEGVEE